MSEEHPGNQTLSDGPWSVRRSAHPDCDLPIGITIAEPGEDGQPTVLAIPLNRFRAALLIAALEEAVKHVPWTRSPPEVE
jgi:hypothetical protein